MRALDQILVGVLLVFSIVMIGLMIRYFLKNLKSVGYVKEDTPTLITTLESERHQ